MRSFLVFIPVWTMNFTLERIVLLVKIEKIVYCYLRLSSITLNKAYFFLEVYHIPALMERQNIIFGSCYSIFWSKFWTCQKIILSSVFRNLGDGKKWWIETSYFFLYFHKFIKLNIHILDNDYLSISTQTRYNICPK